MSNNKTYNAEISLKIWDNAYLTSRKYKFNYYGTRHTSYNDAVSDTVQKFIKSLELETEKQIASNEEEKGGTNE